MSRAVNALVCVAVAALAVVALVLLAPVWAPALGLEAWDLPTLLDQLVQEQARAGELEGQVEECAQRSVAKTAVARAAADGRLALEDAAQRFRDLDRAAPAFVGRAWRLETPGKSDEERYRSAVRQYVAIGRRGDEVAGSGAARLPE
jgi:hypothetical protein